MVKSIRRFNRFIHCSERYSKFWYDTGEGFIGFTVGTKDDEGKLPEGPNLCAMCG